MSAATIDDTEQVKALIGAAPRPAWRRSLPWLVLLSLVAVAGLVAPRLLRARAASKVVAYDTAEVRRGDLVVSVGATGALETLGTVEVGAEVTGRVLTVTVEANDAVKKGQVLATIDPEQLRAALLQASAQLGTADAAIRVQQATVAETSAVLARSEKLRGEGLASQADYDAALAQKRRADANLASAQASATLASANVTSARSKLDKTTILAPMDGFVLSKLVAPGQTVTAGFTTPVMFKIAPGLAKMKLEVDVDEADVGRVHDGLLATFTVEAYPGKKFPSRVGAVLFEPKTSSNVVTYQALLTVDNAEGLLRPGMTSTATITAETRPNVLLVPNQALRFTPAESKEPVGFGPPGGKPEVSAGKRVWVLEGTKPKAIAVKTGTTDGTSTEIVEGDLPVGAQVLLDEKETP